MIKPQDLCIGNYVYDGDKTKFPMYVQTIGEDYVYLNFDGNESDPWETTPEELQGIPLTVDILRKLGFEWVGGEIWQMELEDAWVSIVGDFLSVDYYKRNVPYSRCTIHGVLYLHQLQNIFYNVCQEQLKVNL